MILLFLVLNLFCEVGHMVKILMSRYVCFRTPTTSSSRVPWPTYTTQHKQYLFMSNTTTEIRRQIRPDKMALWHELVPQLLDSTAVAQANAKISSTNCWTIAVIVIVVVVALFIILTLVFLVHYIRLKQKLQRVKYLHSLPEKS